MQKIFNFLPIFTFFISYQMYNIFIATKLLIIISSIIILLNWWIFNQINLIDNINFLLVLIFGLLTLIFHNSEFIKWKISIIYFLYSLFLIWSYYFFKTPLIHFFLSKDIGINDNQWKKLNYIWSVFFFLCAILNLYIMFYCSEKFWVYFKTLSFIIITIIFIIINFLYIYIIKKQQNINL